MPKRTRRPLQHISIPYGTPAGYCGVCGATLYEVDGILVCPDPETSRYSAPPERLPSGFGLDGQGVDHKKPSGIDGFGEYQCPKAAIVYKTE